MKTPKSLFTHGLLALLLIFSFTSANATENCLVSKDHGQGYTSSISLVTDNGDGTHTISLYITQEGPASCKKLKRYSVEAETGTYSDISVTVLTGNMQYSGITFGPFLPSDPFTGFRLNNISGIGHGQSGSFVITYTLSGGLQNQRVKAKFAQGDQTQSFTQEEFQWSQDCAYPPPTPDSDILPYYEPLPEGKSFDIIGSELTSLYNNPGTYESNYIFQIDQTKVLILILTKPGQYANALSLLTSPAYGLEFTSGNPANNLISGLFPIENLLSLNILPDLLISASPIYTPLNNAGLIESQGDKSLRSDISRNVFHINGEGTKVGVISDSYNTILGDPAGDDIIKGDLPGPLNPDFSNPVDLLLDYPFGTRSDEGRAMLQIVHDIAPAAELAFRTGFLGPVDFAHGIHALHNAGCDVIVDDVTYISELFFRDGVVAQAVDSVTLQGTSYFSAAGNFGTRSWEGDFNASPAPTGITGEANNFAADESGIDIFQNVTLYQGQYTLVLQWDDGTPGTTTNSDFDIYLTNENGITLFGFNRVNTDGFPIEVLPFTVAADSTQSNIMIIRNSGFGATKLKYIVYRGDLVVNEYDSPGASTITGQANASGAMAVGAVLFSNTPEYSGSAPTIASFSSRGGTPVNDNVRIKPDFCAPNGVNTSVDLGGVNFDDDEFPNFFGTSASAPHAAGVAALVLQARQKYYGDTLNPLLLKSILQNTAYDMGTPGFDLQSGAGFILADSALLDLANPSPYLVSLSYDTTLTPGLDDIWVTIHGEYLKSGATVWFNGEPLSGESIIQGDTAISALISAYTDLYPAIQVYNEPKEGTNGLDGGLSNPLYFTTKQTIVISVDDKAKKYAEVMPEFTAAYSLQSLTDSIPFGSSDLTAEEVARIQDITLTTIASNLSNVGLWGIEADPADPLSPNSETEATDALDISLLQRFNIVVNSGILTIDPLDLLITPRDTSFVYNDSIVGFTFDYLFNNDSTGSIIIGEPDSLALLSTLQSAHNTPREPVLVRGTALVNSEGEELLNGTVLTNKTIAVSQSEYITRGTALVNGEQIDPLAFYNATAFTNSSNPAPSVPATFVRGTALVNGFQLVRGTALVNTVDEDGNVTNTTALTNSNTLINSSGDLNSTTINASSNTETIVILGEGDIAILSGDSVGNVEIRSINLITGKTVGTHLAVPGVLFSKNFNVRYGVGSFEVLPDTASFSIDLESLTQIYDGTPKTIGVTSIPDSLEYTITYDGDTIPPVNAGEYGVVITPIDSNYVGSAEATLTIIPAVADIIFDSGSLSQTYDGSPKSVSVSTIPDGLAIDISYNGDSELPVNTGSYPVTATISNPNYSGSASAELVIHPAEAQIVFDPATLTQTYDNTLKTPGITTIPAGLNFNIIYEIDLLPINPGTYTINVEVDEPNYVGSGSTTLIILPAMASITIDPESMTQVYDGLPKSVSAATNPEGLAIDISYDGDSELPVNAGTYLVTATINDPNYIGTVSTELVITPAEVQIEFDPETLTQIYDNTVKTPGITTIPEGLNFTVSYENDILPINPGTYAIDVEIEEPNFSGSSSTSLVILPATVTINIDPESLSQDYNGLPKSILLSFNPEGLNSIITYNGLSDPPVNVGSYDVNVSVTTPFYNGSANATLVINPLDAIISTGTYVINAGDPIPDFEATFDGFINGDNPSDVSSVLFELSPEYSGNAGTYDILPTATATNYIFESINGKLFVNPYGPGTIPIFPFFLCREELNKPDTNGFTFIAHFGYYNFNATDVFVPKGINNRIMGATNDDTLLPEIFTPGWSWFDIPYDGNQMEWRIRSNSYFGGSITLRAHAWAVSCNGYYNSGEKALDVNENENHPTELAYPNPSHGKVFLSFDSDLPTITAIEVYDYLGRKCDVPSQHLSDQFLEIDLTGVSKGMYIIRIARQDQVESYTVMIQ